MKITTAIGRWAKFKVIKATNWLEVTVNHRNSHNNDNRSTRFDGY